MEISKHKTFQVLPDPMTLGDRYNPVYIKDNYFCVINVADSPCGAFIYNKFDIQSYWFPIHEIGQWGYSPFYGTAKILDYRNSLNDPRPILIHCHAGVNRSRCVAHAILEAEGLENDLGVEKLFDRNIRNGYIPHDVIAFLKQRHINKTYSICGLLKEINSPNLIYKKNIEESSTSNQRIRKIEMYNDNDKTF